MKPWRALLCVCLLSSSIICDEFMQSSSTDASLSTESTTPTPKSDYASTTNPSSTSESFSTGNAETTSTGRTETETTGSPKTETTGSLGSTESTGSPKTETTGSLRSTESTGSPKTETTGSLRSTESTGSPKTETTGSLGSTESTGNPKTETTRRLGSTESTPMQSSAAPASTTPIGDGLTTVAWRVPLNDTDPSRLLRDIAALNLTVLGLQSELQAIQDSLTGNNDFLIQLSVLNNTIQGLLSDSSDATTALTSAQTQLNLTTIQAAFSNGTMTCIRNSSCLVRTTTTTTTPHPTDCPSSPLYANDSHQAFSYFSVLLFDCATIIRSADSNPLTLNVSIVASDATVQLYSTTDGSFIKELTVNESLTLNYTGVRLTYKANNANAKIDLTVDYKTHDLCEDTKCENGGSCAISNGQPICICATCYSGDLCQTEKNACEGLKPARKCTNLGNTCEKYPHDDLCDWKCDCQTGYHNPPDDVQSCVADSPLHGLLQWL